jgi:hypothetical protein
MSKVDQRRKKKQADRINAYRDEDMVRMRRALNAQKEANRQLATKHAEEIGDMRSRLEQADHEHERLERLLELAKIEIEQLTHIIERDRRRIEAETAIHTGRIEAATAGLMRAEE